MPKRAPAFTFDVPMQPPTYAARREHTSLGPMSATSAELDDASSSGRGDHDAKSIDLGSSGKQIGDDEFVEVTAGEDASFRESRLIKAAAHLAGQVHEIATVQADTFRA